MINLIKSNFYKIKLINNENYLYAIFSISYKILNIKIFKILSIFAYPRFKSLPKYYCSINDKLKPIFDKNLKKINIIEIGGGEMYGMFPFFNKRINLKKYILIDPFVKSFIYKSKLLKYFLKKKNFGYKFLY